MAGANPGHFIFREGTKRRDLCSAAKGFLKMRMNELARYFDKYVDFDAIGERIDALQERLSKLRDNLPEAPVAKMRERLPGYAQVRRRLPYAPKERSYALPATLAVGGIAILGAIVVTAMVMSDVNKRLPKRNQDMV
jgi:hypothetical protein